MEPIPVNPFAVVPALELIGVTVASLKDSSVRVLEDVNWRVHEGEYWAIGGLLRSGKSDLVATAAGLMRPVRGTYRVFGKDEFLLERDRLALRRRIGLVFDGGQLLHDLTLAENIALPLHYHESPDNLVAGKRIEALMAFTDLEAWAHKYPQEVSWNWRQRVGLARALALNPDVMLLDSPLSGLDPRDASWWLQKMDSLHRGDAIAGGRAITIVSTGDDFRPWRERATHFAVVKDGQFIALGGQAELAGHTEPLLRELLPAAVSKT
jgi:ABC-type transporter Mla maintaining outer membrane lipid asymmetry ATPase subunit MlaF